MFVDLSDEQIRLILKHHKFLEGLASGIRHPETDAQKQFVQVVRGEISASTDYECAYVAWKRSGVSLSVLEKKLAKTQQQKVVAEQAVAKEAEIPKASEGKLSERAKSVRARKTATTKSEIAQEKKTPVVERDKIPGAGLAPKQKKYARKVAEPWGSREDYKRDRASWKKGGS